MRPLISEFSYGYALTEELITSASMPLSAAPLLTSLISEGRKGGGYDVKIPMRGMPIFIQFKLSDYMMSRKAAEWELFDSNYYRMHLRASKYSDQHQLLIELERKNKQVYYAAPYFYTPRELSKHYRAKNIAAKSVWFSPRDIGKLPDNRHHYMAFRETDDFGYFCSANPKQKKNTILGI